MTLITKALKYYVSVTGLRVKSMWHMPRFIYYISRIDSASAAGNIETMFTGRNGVQHTLTVWDDRKSMMRFLASGPHAAAMKATSAISAVDGTKVYGYYSDTIPTWDEALALWDEHGTMHGKKPPKAKNNDSNRTSPEKATATTAKGEPPSSLSSA